MNRSIFAVVLCSFYFVLSISLAQADSGVITSLGRIEPSGGIIELAGPSGTAAVISQLNVKEGDRVTKGQVLAILDSYAKRKADLNRLQAILSNAAKQLKRREDLSRSSAISATQLDEARLDVLLAKADIEVATAELNQAQVKSPIDGQILEIHSYPGERISDNGLLELGQTQTMYVVAEVYETEISKISVGQRATITSDAIPQTLSGTVERIGLKIGKTDVLDTDPVAKADARVIETYIVLDDSEAVARFTNLQVEVRMEP
jgi:HlyD family secretion protein